MATQRLSADALAVLRKGECDAACVRITSGQLDRRLYEEVNEVLVRLGGKWKGGRTKAHLFPYDPRPLLAGVLATGEMPPKNPLAFFPTPSHWVEHVMESSLFDRLQDGDDVLEPSAGGGALAEGMRQRLAHRQVHIECCELSSINQQVLRDKGFEIVGEDFLAYQPQKHYRAIVMNPPFSVEQDRLAYITHIRHAWELVAEGGFLIAFAPPGYTFRTDKQSYDFLSFVLTYGGWEALPAKSFHESGTDSAITLITLEKQDLSWRYAPYQGCPTWFCWEITVLAENGDDALCQIQQRLREQLNRGDLCADPKHPAWSHTQEAIRDYYQAVIAKARKQDHQHLEIRPQDWPFLEEAFMLCWDDTWKARYDQQTARRATAPTCEEVQPDAIAPVPHDHEAHRSEPSLSTKREAHRSEPDISEEAGESIILHYSEGTLLYSPLPCDTSLSYEQLTALSEHFGVQRRDDYPALPWCMEHLIGTTWRHISTGEAQMVHHLATNRFNKPVLCAVPATPFTPDGQRVDSIGFWSGNHYLVEQWMRVDLQSEETQLCWFGVELAWLHKQLTVCEHKLAEYCWDRTNRKLYLRAKQEYQRQLHLAEVGLHAFADKYHLSIPLAVLNSGIVGSEGNPAQMALL